MIKPYWPYICATDPHDRTRHLWSGCCFESRSVHSDQPPHQGFSRKDPWRPFCTAECCCVQPCFSLQSLASICGVGLCQQALCVPFTALWSVHTIILLSTAITPNIGQLYLDFAGSQIWDWVFDDFMSFSLLQGGIKAVVWTDVFQVNVSVESNVVHDLPLECSMNVTDGMDEMVTIYLPDWNNACRLFGCHHQICDYSRRSCDHHFRFPTRREAQLFWVRIRGFGDSGNGKGGGGDDLWAVVRWIDI